MICLEKGDSGSMFIGHGWYRDGAHASHGAEEDALGEGDGGGGGAEQHEPRVEPVVELRRGRRAQRGKQFTPPLAQVLGTPLPPSPEVLWGTWKNGRKLAKKM